jgi:hypothetical protein
MSQVEQTDQSLSLPVVDATSQLWISKDDDEWAGKQS